jgi:hypothetical protein
MTPRSGRGPVYPNAGFSDHNKMVVELVSVEGEESSQDTDDVSRRLIIQAKQDHTPVSMLIAKDKIAKVLVCRDDDPVFAHRPTQDVVVEGPSTGVIDRNDIMSLSFKPLNDRGTKAFVNDASHLCGRRGEWGERRVDERLTREQHTRSHVITCQARILGEHVLD